MTNLSSDSYGDDAIDHDAERINQETLDKLGGTRPWVLFLSILGFILTGLYALMTVGALVMGGRMGGAGSPFLMIVLLYSVSALIYFFLSLFLFKYSTRIGEFTRTGHINHLNDALAQQLAFWRLVGILAAIGVVLILLALMFAIIGGGLAASM